MSEVPLTSLERLRRGVAERVRATSLRAVARQVGMSPSGLEKFLSGGVPYQKSRRRLFEWLNREGASVPARVQGDDVTSVLASLVRDLPAERRERALGALLDTLRSLYDAHAGAAPAWLGELTGPPGGDRSGRER
jgi:hypothetical protein